MNGKEKPRWWNFWFHRFFIEAVKNIRQPYLGYLTSEDRLHLRKLDNFIVKGSLDEKLDILGRIGYRFALCIVDSKKSDKAGLTLYARLFHIFRKKTGFDRKAAVSELSEMGMFVMVEADFVKSMKMTADIYNSASFNEVSSFIDAHDNLFSYNKRMIEFRKHHKAISDIDRLISNIMRINSSLSELQAFKNSFQIDFAMYRVLAELSANRTTRYQTLKEKFSTPYFPRMLKEMREKQLVEEIPVGFESAYSITGVGEDMLSQAREYLINIIYKLK